MKNSEEPTLYDLARELKMDSTSLLAELRKYRNHLSSNHPLYAIGMPASNTIGGWFSASKKNKEHKRKPSREGLSFILSYIFDQHDNIKTSYSEFAKQKLLSSRPTLNYSDCVILSYIQLEEQRRAAYIKNKAFQIDRHYSGIFCVVREKFNHQVVMEPMVIKNIQGGNTDSHRSAIWRMNSHHRAGDIYYGRDSISGIFVRQTTDIIMNPVTLHLQKDENILINPKKHICGKLSATNKKTQSVYSKNIILIPIGKTFNYNAHNYSYFSEKNWDFLTRLENELKDANLNQGIKKLVKENSVVFHQSDIESAINDFDEPLIWRSGHWEVPS